MSSISNIGNLILSPGSVQPRQQAKLPKFEGNPTLKDELQRFLRQYDGLSHLELLTDHITQYLPLQHESIMTTLFFSMHEQLKDFCEIANTKQKEQILSSYFQFVEAYFKEENLYRAFEYHFKNGSTFDCRILAQVKKKYKQRCKPFADRFQKLINIVCAFTKDLTDENKKVLLRIKNDIHSKVSLLETLSSEDLLPEVWESLTGAKKSPKEKTLGGIVAKGARNTPASTFLNAMKEQAIPSDKMIRQGFAFFEDFQRYCQNTDDEYIQSLREIEKAYFEHDIFALQLHQSQMLLKVRAKEMGKTGSLSINLKNPDSVFTEVSKNSLRTLIIQEHRRFCDFCEESLERIYKQEDPSYLTQLDILEHACELRKGLKHVSILPNVENFKGKRKYFHEFEQGLKEWHKPIDLEDLNHVFDRAFSELQAQNKLVKSRFWLVAKDNKGVPLYLKIERQFQEVVAKLPQLSRDFVSKVKKELKKESEKDFPKLQKQILARWKVVSFPVIKKILYQFYASKLAHFEELQGKSPDEVNRLEIEGDERLQGLVEYLSVSETLQQLSYEDLHPKQVKAPKKEEKPLLVDSLEKVTPEESESKKIEETQPQKQPISIESVGDNTFKLHAPQKLYEEKPERSITSSSSSSKETKEEVKEQTTSETSSSKQERYLKKLTENRRNMNYRKLASILKKLGLSIGDGTNHAHVAVGKGKVVIPRHGGSKGIKPGTYHAIVKGVKKNLPTKK
jgi:hypothetical protein